MSQQSSPSEATSDCPSQKTHGQVLRFCCVPDLPIAEHVDEIAQLICNHQVVIVAGETGSGKTTQLPKICLGLGRQSIAHTQPRRLAARTVAERIADELSTEIGDEVGYQVRFTSKRSAKSKLTLMTDGILLNEISHDRLLRRYDTIIIDEAHERSLNIDFLIGYLKLIAPKRPDLKIIITSATIDTLRFSAHFDDAPIVEVSGRTYPVEIRYRPLEPENESASERPSLTVPEPGLAPDARRPGGEESGVSEALTGAQPDGSQSPNVSRPSRSTPDNTAAATLDQADAIVFAIDELIHEGPGDILVFCSGEREIADAKDAIQAAIKSRDLPDLDIRPLYARLSAADQHLIFQPHQQRRVVLATNIAETSLTVPGIRFVIDAGTARISRFSGRTKVQRLPIEPISRASANQRAGRCGRVGPGICIRLYSESDYASRAEFTEPEILRTNLASVIVKMVHNGLGDIESFPFLEAPEHAQIADGITLLRELGAIKASDRRPGRSKGDGSRIGRARGAKSTLRLTKIGHRLAQIPVDPRLGRMLIEADRRRCLSEVQIIVAGLAIPDVREYPAEQRELALQLHARFFRDTDVEASLRPESDRSPGDPRSQGRVSSSQTGSAPDTNHVDPAGDIAAMLRLWRYLKQLRKDLSRTQQRKRCRAEFINYLRVREWQDLRTQLKQISRDLAMNVNDAPGSIDDVVISVLSGLLTHVGLLEPEPANPARGGKRRPRLNRQPRHYLGARGAKFVIQPGSALAKRPPSLIVAVELVETSRLWARTVAAVEPDWVLQLGAHLTKSTYAAPHWSSSAGAVLATEKVYLYGVPIVADRLINYASVNPVEAREIFIQQALVEGNWNPRYDFIDHNQRIYDEVADLEERSRRRDILVSDREIFDFYDRRLPSTVNSQSSFAAWWGSADPHCLDMSVDDLILDQVGHPHDSFPNLWTVGDAEFPVSYVFDPGSVTDGVTVTIPLTQLNQVRPETFSWHVPGMRLELVTELIRSLPKKLRTNFVPAPDVARRALEWIDRHAQPRNLNSDTPGNTKGQTRPTGSIAATASDFREECGAALTALTGIAVSASDFAVDQLPQHLRINFAVTDHGETIAVSKDLAELTRELSPQISKALTQSTPTISGRTSWDFGPVDNQVFLSRGDHEAIGFPAVIDQKDGVGVQVFDTASAAAMAHSDGLRRLLILANPDPIRWVVSHMTNHDKLALGFNPYESVPDLLRDCWLKACEQLMLAVADPIVIRDEKSFSDLQLAVRQRQADQTRQVAAVVAEIMRHARQVRSTIDSLDQGLHIADDLNYQYADLIYPGFVSATPDPWFNRISAYLQAMAARIEQFRLRPERDDLLCEPLWELEDRYIKLCNEQPPGRFVKPVEDVGFMLEELRVQIFAQRLGTQVSVSPKRVGAALSALGA